MLQQIMTEPGVITFKEVEIPKAQDGQVVLKMMKIGVCGSDVHVYHGEHPFTPYPVTQGHEVSGEVYEVGTGVTGLNVGQAVTIQPQIVCNACFMCKKGDYHICENLKVMGFQTVGAGSHYFAVDAKMVTPLPSGMSYDEGAMIEPLAVGVHAIRRIGDVTGKSVVVIGAGPIGNLLAQAAKGMGARKVLITDIVDFRLQKAKECGIDACINTKNIDFGDAINEHFGEEKADFIFDCAGNEFTLEQALKNGRNGSTIVLVAIFAGTPKFSQILANHKEIIIDTSFMYKNEDYLGAIELINQNKITLQPLITKHFAFKEFKQAYEYIDQNKDTTLKVIVNVQE